MRKPNHINFQKSAYYKKRELKSVIYLKSVGLEDNYILPQELKLIRGSKMDNKWYRLHIPEDLGWSKGVCKLTQDPNDEYTYNGLAFTHEETILISIQILPKLSFCHLKAYGYREIKELRLLSVA